MKKLKEKSLILSGPYGYTPCEHHTDYRDREDISTFFYQGHGASRAQAACYTGVDGVYMSVNGDRVHITCPGAPKLLYNVYEYEELSEICYGESQHPVRFVSKLITTARHLLVNLRGSIPYSIDFSAVSLSGDADIAQFVTYYERMTKDTPSKCHVVFGSSRGAATAVIGVSSLHERLQKSISLVIAEAPFDSITSLLKETYPLPELHEAGLNKFTGYRSAQETPLEAIEHFPLFVPIAFVTSKADKRIPQKCTLRLINRLRERGHQMVHHLELENSHHSVMSLHNASDIKRYYEFLQSMYSMYCGDSE